MQKFTGCQNIAQIVRMPSPLLQTNGFAWKACVDNESFWVYVVFRMGEKVVCILLNSLWANPSYKFGDTILLNESDLLHPDVMVDLQKNWE